MSPHQYGFMPQKSTEDSLYVLMQNIRTNLKDKKIVTIVSLDIEGAFDSAWWPAIKTRLAEEGCPVNVRRVFGDYMGDRSVEVRYAGEGVNRRTSKGCVQGSIAGPILWNLLLDPLLKELVEKGNTVQAFADDVVLLFVGNTAEEIQGRANATLAHVGEWGVRNKLKFAPHKTHAITLTKKLKYDTPRLSMGGIAIENRQEMKILGVTIDSGLTFNSHVKNVCRKAVGIHGHLTRAAKVSWGLNPEVIKTIYVAAVEPVIMYAASVWAPAASKITTCKQLNSIQRGFAQKMCRAYRTVSLNAALVLTGMLPLDIRIKEAAALYEARKGVPRPELKDREVEMPLSALSLPHPAEQVDIKLESQTEETVGELDIRVYTDGSKIDGRVGAALSLWRGDAETKAVKLALPSYCTVYQAELMAIHRASELIVKRSERTFGIYSDSMAALQTVSDITSLHPLAIETRNNIKRAFTQGKHVTLAWVKAHVGLAGNERADQLAKEAAVSSKSKHAYDKCPVSFVKRLIRNESLEEWNSRYTKSENAEVTKLFLPDAVKAYTTTRKLTHSHLQTQLLTGHGGFSQYLNRFKCRDNPSCICDPDKEETIVHLIVECPVHSTERYNIEQELDTAICVANFNKLIIDDESREKFLKYCCKIVKTVTGVVGRADVLACVFFLSSLLLYHGLSGRHRVWSSVALAALSMLAKETGLTVLLFNMAFDLYRCWNPLARLSTGVKSRWRSDSLCGRVVRVLCALVLLVSVRLAILQGSLPAFSPQDNPPAFHPSFTVRLMTFWYLAAFNWWLLLCPWTLSHDWQMGSVPLVTSGWDPRNLLTCAAIIALLALSYRSIVDLELQRHTPVAVGLMLLVIPYLPASNLLVTVGFVVAERVLYIPSVGSVILTVYGIELVWRRFPGSRRLLLVAAAALVAAGVARTHLRNRDWRTRETLLRADLAVLPHNAKLHYNFANFMKDIEQHENAIKHYKEALKLWPSYASAHNNLGTLVSGWSRAEHHFLQALKYNRDHVNAHYNLAKLYRKKNRINESLKMLERCITLEPRFVQAYVELLLITEDGDKRAILDKLLELEPNNWEHYILYGNWLKDRGLLPLSLEFYTTAMRLSFTRGTQSQERGKMLSVRAACLALRSAGQRAQVLQLVTRWQAARRGAQPAGARARAAAAWRLRTELAGRAALYARPRIYQQPTTSTCLHHSHLEVSPDSYIAQKHNEIKHSRTFLPKSELSVSDIDKVVETGDVKNSCHKTNEYTKKSVSISAQYKPTHNKSETGHKQKSCPLHKKKKMKDPETFTPFVSDHLIKTY